MDRIGIPPSVHFELTGHTYSMISNFFLFLYTEGYIEQQTYDMMSKEVDKLFECYKYAFYDLEDLKAKYNENSEEQEDDGKIQ